jgi:hypothetical protein
MSGRVPIEKSSTTTKSAVAGGAGRLLSYLLYYYAFELRTEVGSTIEDWSAGATIGGSVIPNLPDLARMRRERFGRLQDQLEASGLDGLVLLGSSSVTYATRAAMPA